MSRGLDETVVYADQDAELFVIATLHADEDGYYAHKDDDCYDESDWDAFNRGSWDYVGIDVSVHYRDDIVGNFSLWGIESGTMGDGTECDPFEFVPADRSEPGVVVMGSPLADTVAESLFAARDRAESVVNYVDRKLAVAAIDRAEQSLNLN